MYKPFNNLKPDAYENKVLSKTKQEDAITSPGHDF